VALFFWYFLRTRGARNSVQWIVLGLLGALMMNVYYPNALVMAVLIPEAIADYLAARKSVENSSAKIVGMLGHFALFLLVAFAGMLPTFLSR
jgi:hypothetical protein